MDTITKKGIDICVKAYAIIKEKNKNFAEEGKPDTWDKAFIYDDFVDCYVDFTKYLEEMNPEQDSVIEGEKFLAYVKLWGVSAKNTKTFTSLNREGAITQSRTTMIKNVKGQMLTMPEEIKRLGLELAIKGWNK
jgi:hypothetical protein